jgi:ribonuclease HI
MLLNPLPWSTTSQKAELITLTRALTLAEGKTTNIFTDSKYAYHIIHHHAALWEERGFLTTKGTPITNGSLILKLLKASYLPTKVARNTNQKSQRLPRATLLLTERQKG